MIDEIKTTAGKEMKPTFAAMGAKSKSSNINAISKTQMLLIGSTREENSPGFMDPKQIKAT